MPTNLPFTIIFRRKNVYQEITNTKDNTAIMENNEKKQHLLDRIKRLETQTIERMSFEGMAMLTNNFEESLVKALPSTTEINSEQRRIIRAVKKAYKEWYRDINPYVRIGYLKYPTYMDELQMDVECDLVVTEKGTFDEPRLQVKVSRIFPGAIPLKPVPRQVWQTKEETGSAEKALSCKGIDSASLQARISELEQENQTLRSQLEAHQGTAAQETITSLQEEVERWKDELAAYKERQQNRAGINRLQTAHLGLKIAPLLGINVTNKKDLAPMLSKLFGWGQRSMEQQLCKYISMEEEMEVAKIFGDLSPELATRICSDFQGTPEEDTEAPPAD